MRNLADVANADVYIRKELGEACIEIVPLGAKVPLSEVNATFVGRLKMADGSVIDFKREAVYWVARTKIPMKVALKLYANLIGRNAVRVDGNCTCPAPDERHAFGTYKWAYHPNDKLLFPYTWYRKSKFLQGVHDLYRWALSVWPWAHWYIDRYHIDSQEGLNFFVQTLQEEKLVA